MIGIIGKKLGMTQIFNEQGQQIPCTVVEASRTRCVKVTDKAKAGFASVSSAMATQRIARESKKGEQHAARPPREQGARSATRRRPGSTPRRACCAASASTSRPTRSPRSRRYNVGDTITVDIFSAGER